MWTPLLQAIIVLGPTYLIAYLTDKMVYTIPMLAATSFVAAAIKNPLITHQKDNDPLKRTDDSRDSSSSE